MKTPVVSVLTHFEAKIGNINIDVANLKEPLFTTVLKEWV